MPRPVGYAHEGTFAATRKGTDTCTQTDLPGNGEDGLVDLLGLSCSSFGCHNLAFLVDEEYTVVVGSVLVLDAVAIVIGDVEHLAVVDGNVLFLDFRCDGVGCVASDFASGSGYIAYDLSGFRYGTLCFLQEPLS